MKGKWTALHIECTGVKKLTLLAVLLAVGLVLGVLEGMLPVFAVLPGAKLGIANVVTMLALVWFGPFSALLIGVLRAGLVGIFSGMATMAFYGGAGSVLSVAAMFLMRRFFGEKTSLAGVSMVGAFFFQVGQVAVFAAVIHNIQMFRYLPVLTLISTVCGLVTGWIAEKITKFQMTR